MSSHTAPAAWSALALLALALSRRRVWARAAVGVGVGALLAAGSPPDPLAEVARDRVVSATVAVAEPGRVEAGERGASWHCRVRILELSQGRRTWRPGAPAHLRVSVSGEASSGESVPIGHDLASALEPGARLVVRGYLGRSPPLRNLRSERPGPWRLSVPSPRFVDIASPPAAWRRPVNRLRDHLTAELDGWRDPGAAALVATLWLGDRSGLPERWRRALRAWGLAHLTAVSGLHVGVVALLLWGVGAFLPRPARLALGLAGVVAYALLVGPRPSVLRAAVMALVAIAGLLVERPPDALNALAVAVAALVAFDPPVVFDLGFQLSAAATAGLLVLTRPIARRLSGRRDPPAWALALASSLAAQLATLPIAAPAFAVIHPASPVVQLPAVPWLVLCLLLGSLALLTGSLADGLGPWLGPWLVTPLTLPLELLADLPAGPWACWPVSLTPGSALLLGALALGLLAAAPRRRHLAALLLLGLVWRGHGAAGPAAAPRPGEVTVTALDVGQGDAVLLRSPDTAILVDGGGWRRGDSAARLLLPALADLGVRRLDVAILSHPDHDHCDGLRDLASYVPIGEVWSAAGWPESCAGEVLGDRGAALRVLWRGRTVRRGAWRFETLWPPAGDRTADGNSRSLVLRAGAAGRLLMLTGDVDRDVEARLLATGGDDALASDVLKVAHHGSKSSTSRRFLAAVAPRLAVVQAGRANTYGHPHRDVLHRLAARPTTLWRTDRHGQVELRWRAGGEIRVRVRAGDP